MTISQEVVSVSAIKQKDEIRRQPAMLFSF